MTLQDCKIGDKVYIHDPYVDITEYVCVDGNYYDEEYDVEGIKVTFILSGGFTWDVLPPNTICWK